MIWIILAFLIPIAIADYYKIYKMLFPTKTICEKHGHKYELIPVEYPIVNSPRAGFELSETEDIFIEYDEEGKLLNYKGLAWGGVSERNVIFYMKYCPVCNQIFPTTQAEYAYKVKTSTDKLLNQ